MQDPNPAEGMRAVAVAMNNRLDELQEVNEEVLEHLNNIHAGVVQTKLNQAKFFIDHEKMFERIDDLFTSLQKSITGLSLQVRDIRDDVNC